MNLTSPVAAIIAAYNEEPTIGAIVRTLVSSGLFRDIIVISDGSTDRTAEISRAAGATLVHQFPWNHGKGAAMMHGASHTDAPMLLFLDADLKGLDVAHLQHMLEPVVSGRLAMCIGIWDRGRLGTMIATRLPLISGQRAMARHVFENVPGKYLQGFMAEIALNYYCRIHALPYGAITLNGLGIRHKMQKVGFWKGLFEYLRMGYSILRGMFVVRLARWRGEFA